ncbi:MAG: RagB/SusD family nutrient uptake outer membrane protein, partial [Pedobacter sp.]|nr:RagB/SusD family nutrient uptake outer membrane protein [Chitinophagaceae bacterium]
GNAAGTNQYFNIRRCNLAIKGIDAGTLTDDVKLKLKGQFYFLRAYTYFNLVKLYGGMPLVLTAQDIAADDLNVPRSKTSVCIDAIAKDLDSCYGLPSVWPTASTDRGRITRGAALALKGKVLMFWASEQFNPNNSDPARWERAYLANKAAYDSLTKDGYALNANFGNIFTDESVNNKEPILLRNYDAISISPGRGTNIENLLRPVSETSGGGGSYQPTWNLVKAFAMNTGVSAYNVDGSATLPSVTGFDSILFWKNRDPRFEFTIAYNGSTWPLSGKAGRKQWNYLNVGEDASKQSSTGFYCKKISNATISATAALYNSNTGGGSGMDWIEMRFAEVLLNLAECANESIRSSEAAALVIKLRQRAGILPGTGSLYGLPSASVPAAQMRSIIMNERQVEFAMEGKRYDDLRRTKLFSNLNGTIRQGYRWTVKAPYTIAILETINAAGFKPRDTITITNAASINSIFTPSLTSLETGGNTITFPSNYYFYPLPQNFLLSSSVIQQTIGWPGGSFNPLQ